MLPIVSSLIGLGETVIERVIPDPEQKAQAKLAFAAQAASLDQKQLQGFRDFVVEYEGRAADIHWSMQILRGSVRPVLTYALAGLYGYGFVNPGDFPPEVMQGLFQLNLLSLGFWFGERAMKKLGVDQAIKRKANGG